MSSSRDAPAADRHLDAGDVADQPAGREADEHLVDIGAGDPLGLLDRLADRDLALLHVGDEAALDAAALALAGAEDAQLAVLARARRSARRPWTSRRRARRPAFAAAGWTGAPRHQIVLARSCGGWPGIGRRGASGTRAPGSRETRTIGAAGIAHVEADEAAAEQAGRCWSMRAKRWIARRAASLALGQGQHLAGLEAQVPAALADPGRAGDLRPQLRRRLEQARRARRAGGWRRRRSPAADRASPRPAPARAPRPRRRSGSAAR